jgi:hypothetical protein
LHPESSADTIKSASARTRNYLKVVDVGVNQASLVLGPTVFDYAKYCYSLRFVTQDTEALEALDGRKLPAGDVGAYAVALSDGEQQVRWMV